MADTTLASLQVIANVVVVATTLAIAALIVARINWRAPAAREPLGVAFAVVFLAIGVNAAVRTALGGDARTSLTMVVTECLMVAAMLGFLLLHRRYGVFVESAHMVREFETEFAAKDREARALAQVNEELRRLDELKSEFLAMVSHELRTPLTAIIGYSRLLMRQIYGPLTDKQLEQQEAIFRSAQRLTDLINDLLDVSQLEAGRVEIDPRPTDMRQVTEQVTAVVGVTAQAKQIQISNELAANLPAVLADPGRVHQVLLNLLSNAVKFTPVGGAVRVYGGAHKDQVWTAVEDTGVGIAPAELARIWDPFYQVESPMRSRHGGSGLGLTIVRRLVELHGGLVRAESNGPNLGSRFVFTLPIAVSPALASRETTPDTLVSAPDTLVSAPDTLVSAPDTLVSASDTLVEPILAGRTVLIVEDEEHNREVMRSVVEDVLGGEALICGDGQSALGQALARQPALILLDLMLPNVSGWEVTRRLREDPRTRAVPIIAVSALARTQEREAALHAGCDAYLTKPFTPDALVKLVTGTVLSEGVAAR